MTIFKCKICGGSLEIADGSSVAVCEYCATKQTIPTAKDEVVANLFNRANSLRLKCEFDKAEQVYEKILDIDNTDSEAHWGLVLCKYGIEYVEDGKANTKIPTCHRTLYGAVLTDVDYLAAIENADAEQKELYEEEAKVIDELQKNILNIVNNEEPFDVFICYKETDDDGKRTIDSSISNDIYYQLTQEGFKVFYAPITLEDKLGYEYEPYIFAALNSAKVMLVIGTKPEYFDSVWVRNEWSRYLKLMKAERSKLLIPCYKDMDAYELPDEFAHLQAQDMSKIGFISDVIRGLKKVIKSEEQLQIYPVEKKERSIKKSNRLRDAWKKTKRCFKREKSNHYLSFPAHRITNVFYVFTIVFYLYFIINIKPKVIVAHDFFMFSLMILPFLFPLLVMLKIVTKKAIAIILGFLGLIWTATFFSDLSYSIRHGIFLTIVLISLLSLIWFTMICLTKKTNNVNHKKKNWYHFISSAVVSVVLLFAFDTFCVSFLDYQIAKVFYHAGAYEYAYEYFDYLDNYKDSDNLEKDSLCNHTLKLIEQGDYESAMIIVDQMANEKKGNEKTNVVLYNIAESLYNSKQHGRAVEILIKLGDFGNAKNLLSDILKKPAPQINTSGYEECTVEELYKNPKKYDGKKVSVTSWKVACYYKNEEKKFYDILLCDDTTYYEYESTSFLGVYRYYKEHILPYGTPYLGVRIFSNFIYSNISGKKSMMTVYGTFTFHSGTEGSRRRGDPHVYNLDVDYYVAY